MADKEFKRFSCSQLIDIFTSFCSLWIEFIKSKTPNVAYQAMNEIKNLIVKRNQVRLSE